MQTTIQYIENELMPLYPASEISSFIRLILEKVYGLSYTEQVILKHEKLDGNKFKDVAGIVARLKQFEPIQYILGETEFYDLALKVNPAVLIPRPETEELVAWMLETEWEPGARVLDIGTGSGCIALALKSGLPSAQVFGVDVSAPALETAGENAALNQLEVQFVQQNILDWKATEWEKFDLIVSNPPYVRESEKQLMEANVLKHEPTGALFVSDEDPLIFYRTIAEFAQANLNQNGSLFFEINEYLGKEMKALLEGFGFKSIELRKDLQGRDRMICGSK
ncbi:peptide chain release factor N(5)-glutamine methyltransferase [Maribellus sediminis]|uniref:peptide chain release factor N(5)-glutamine methyltransferase n=1 Tax=Maribellus sediminis TaxID=2696285 RepID=UPI00142F6445|nr:peptide chain release factor N(5)-glutamine methyltransferase [Maribellus sediminis]